MKKKDRFKDEPPLPGFSFQHDVSEVMKEYKEMGEALDNMISMGPVQHEMENEFELGHEIAIALKQELRAMGVSRETVCDQVNEYLGRTQERYTQTPPLCRKPLSKAMLDKIIYDPINYPLDSYYLYAFQHVCKGFGIVNAILGAVGAHVVSGEESRKFMKHRAQEFRQKAQSLEKSIGRM